MMPSPVGLRVTRDERIVHAALARGPQRNALNLAIFDALDAEFDALRADGHAVAVLLRGEGEAFCAGFDLAAVVDDPSLMAEYIHRLSRVNRALRRLPQVVVAAVQGAALAGGCALLSACDFVFVAPDATLGYPVHRIGVSPAVTIPTLRLAAGDGPARALLMSGRLIDGREAVRIGLASHLAESSATLHDEATAFCRALAEKGPNALRATKAWLNELDGSLDDAPFDRAAIASASLADGDEAVAMLRAFWSKRKG